MGPRRALGAALAWLALEALAGCADTTTAPAPAARASATPTQAAPPVPAARRADSVVRPRAPTRLTLPSGRAVRIAPAGTTPAGLLAVPDDVGTAGWWAGGSRLGDPFGTILLAAHVDSRTQGLGPFAELLTVAPGARVRLGSAGAHQVFAVSSRRLVPQGSLDDDAWIFDASGGARLALVTCAPPYDASRGGYQNLTVVTALPVGSPEEP